MITFARTTDWDTVKQIVTHPKVYPHVSDDGCVAPEHWEPSQHDSIWYVMVKDDAELLGLFMLHPQNSICYEIHTALLPNAYGKRAREASRRMSGWVWEHLPCRRIVTNVPKYNRLAFKFAREAGMWVYGVNTASFLKHGQLYDQIMLGLSKPEAQ